LSISTKGTWWTKEPKYMALFKKHTHNWHIKISIISDKPEMVKRIELGVDTTDERFEAIARLANIGVDVTFRFRPYLPIMSEDIDSLLVKAKKAGAKGVTTEYFCMESRADEDLKKRFASMSKTLGYDVHSYYMKHSKMSGYKRLNEEIKRPIFTAIRKKAHALGLQFNCSDMYCRDLNDSMNCCGAKDEWSYQGTLQKVINMAKQTIFVKYSMIQKEIDKYFDFKLIVASGFNTSSSRFRAKYGNFTIKQYLRSCWNEQAGKSLAGYGNLFVPHGIDSDNNVIYKYIGSK
jgi:hypothetical protein